MNCWGSDFHQKHVVGDNVAIYDRPVRILMKEMASSLAPNPGTVFTKKQAIEWFATHYPKIKAGTITAHLIRLSTNTVVRLNYSAKPDDDVFFQIDGSHYRLYHPSTDPTPIHSPGNPRDPLTGSRGGEEEESAFFGSDEFAYEKDLRNYLSKNLQIIEPGLKLYVDEEITGIEFPVGGRFIDILAIDAQGDFVVIELKVSRGYDRVVGQLMRYMAWIQKNLAESTQKVRGIIVAREISEDLVLACSLLAGVRLYEYALSLEIKYVDVK